MVLRRGKVIFPNMEEDVLYANYLYELTWKGAEQKIAQPKYIECVQGAKTSLAHIQAIYNIQQGKINPHHQVLGWQKERFERHIFKIKSKFSNPLKKSSILSF